MWSTLTRPLARASIAARLIAGIVLFTASGFHTAGASLPSCPAGQESVYYYQNGGNSLASYSTYYLACLNSKVGGLAKGKTSKGAFEDAVRSCNGSYTSTWESPLEWGSWNGQREFRFCSCTENPTAGAGMACTGKNWRSDGSEGACYPSDQGWIPPSYGIWDVNAGCRACTRTLTLTGGGSVEATKVLGGQTARVTGCYGQPEANVPVQVTATPFDPANGPAGQLRSVGGAGAGSVTFSGMTDASGEVRLEFIAPALTGTHRLTARCYDGAKPCAPDPTAPVTITVTPRVYDLTLQVSAGSVQEGTVQHGHSVNVKLDGVAAQYIPFEVTTAPQQLIYPTAELYPAAGEQASCTSGSVMTCLTDGDGIVEFDFVAPIIESNEDVQYDISARCTNAATPCTPDPAGPSAVTVLGCPLQLTLAASGTVNPGEPDLPGLVAEVTRCGGPADGVPVRVSTSSQHAGQAAGVLSPEAGSDATCGSGAIMDCTTGATGRINFKFVPPAPQQTMDVLHDVVASCTDAAKPCAPALAGPGTVTVKGCPIHLSISGAEARKVEPNGSLGGFVITAEDCLAKPVPSVEVTLRNSWRSGTGGHEHGPVAADPRLGRLVGTSGPQGGPPSSCVAGPAVGTLKCVTNSNGLIYFRFVAPAPAGMHEITASCPSGIACNDAAPIVVDVKVEGLQEASSGYFQYIGQTGEHPYNNHGLRADALSRLRLLSQDYFDEYGDYLCLNDASLEWGGLFDVGCVKDPGDTTRCLTPFQLAAWSTPHKEHRCGSVIDIRAGKPPLSPEEELSCRTIPLAREEAFKEMAADREIDVNPHPEFRNKPNAHYHLYLLSDDFKDSRTRTCQETMPP